MMSADGYLHLEMLEIEINMEILFSSVEEAHNYANVDTRVEA
ncbi:MAG: hypothetical protein WCE94_15160 [Candidatus Methanoperedens sp.]